MDSNPNNQKDNRDETNDFRVRDNGLERDDKNLQGHFGINNDPAFIPGANPDLLAEEASGAVGTQKRKPRAIFAVMILALALLTVMVSLYAAGVFGKKGSPVPLASNSSRLDSSTQPSSVYVNPDEFDPETGVLLKLAEYYKQNADLVGWVTIPGTTLDHPVTQYTDNEYYLNYNLKKEPDSKGVPFLDFRAKLSEAGQSNFLTVHGHNTSEGDGFDIISDYSDIDYYKAHPVIEFDSIYGSGKYKIIGRFTIYVEGDFFNYHDYTTVTSAQYDYYMEQLDQMNLYHSGVDYSYEDRFLVLSTCNFDIQGTWQTPYRDVLIARKIRPGEDELMDITKIEPNTEAVMPDAWVKKYGKQNPFVN